MPQIRDCPYYPNATASNIITVNPTIYSKLRYKKSVSTSLELLLGVMDVVGIGNLSSLTSIDGMIRVASMLFAMIINIIITGITVVISGIIGLSFVLVMLISRIISRKLINTEPAVALQK